jgi:hypothetical protein
MAPWRRASSGQFPAGYDLDEELPEESRAASLLPVTSAAGRQPKRRQVKSTEVALAGT